MALNDLNKAISIDPSHYYAYYNRGNLYDNLGFFDKAIKDYSKAIKLSNDNKIMKSATYVNRGVIYARTKKYEHAIKNYDMAISVDPRSPFPYLYKAMLLYFMKKNNKAIKTYRTFLDISKNKKEALPYFKEFPGSESSLNKGIHHARKRLREIK